MKDYNDSSWLTKNAWGRWGEEDEVGALNEVSAADVLGAVSLIKEDRIYDLETERFKGMPVWNGHWYNGFYFNRFFSSFPSLPSLTCAWPEQLVETCAPCSHTLSHKPQFPPKSYNGTLPFAASNFGQKVIHWRFTGYLIESSDSRDNTRIIQ